MSEDLDTLWGIERNPDSPVRGELVVPVILMWDMPAAENRTAAGLTGALQHGSIVRVTEKRVIDGLAYYYCEATVVAEDETYDQAGWVRATLLKERGASEYGGKAAALPDGAS